ncbi:X-linked retinitis pigmentosa GTPase regulator-interacting protein 1-like [Chrysoperla carnea]|uniref:X-linked retinitis pigmentosa GTPase regulator-interacting protein 1-like n=1 Tax=Chrysoperla carnea TaxID=189513 RepID=UPI001D092179|nr:X-linked retinitis pigmentosa GTPase regulator-interacting protein 1-like [Chrysoperla carnea]
MKNRLSYFNEYYERKKRRSISNYDLHLQCLDWSHLQDSKTKFGLKGAMSDYNLHSSKQNAAVINDTNNMKHAIDQDFYKLSSSLSNVIIEDTMKIFDYEEQSNARKDLNDNKKKENLSISDYDLISPKLQNQVKRSISDDDKLSNPSYLKLDDADQINRSADWTVLIQKMEDKKTKEVKMADEKTKQIRKEIIKEKKMYPKTSGKSHRKNSILIENKPEMPLTYTITDANKELKSYTKTSEKFYRENSILPENKPEIPPPIYTITDSDKKLNSREVSIKESVSFNYYDQGGSIFGRKPIVLDDKNSLMNKRSLLEDAKSSSSEIPKTFVIIIHKLTLFRNTPIISDRNIKQLYIEYTFLNFDDEEMETPLSLPKPEPPRMESLVFNFERQFYFDSKLSPILRDKVENDEVVKFFVISEPVLDSDGECEEVGMVEVKYKDFIYTSADVIKKAFIVKSVRNSNIEIGWLELSFIGVKLLREIVLGQDVNTSQ